LLEVTAHGRAVAVRLVDVRLIGEGDRALEPGVPQRLHLGVGTLLVRDADERETLIEPTRDETARTADRVPAGGERQVRGGGRNRRRGRARARGPEPRSSYARRRSSAPRRVARRPTGSRPARRPTPAHTGQAAVRGRAGPSSHRPNQ